MHLSALGSSSTSITTIAVICLGCGGDGQPPSPHPITTPSHSIDTLLAGFNAPRTVHVALDDRLIITDLGSGRDNGVVMAVDLAQGTRGTLLANLPSTRNSGQRFTDVAGPSGADLSPNGTACAAIGDATAERRGFNTLRCRDGGTTELEELERQLNPGGGELASNPFDTIWMEAIGWLVSDAAANSLLSVKTSGEVSVLATFAEIPGSPSGREGVPTGLFASDNRIFVALFDAAVVELLATDEAVTLSRVLTFVRPIAVHFDEGAASTSWSTRMRPAKRVPAGSFISPSMAHHGSSRTVLTIQPGWRDCRPGTSSSWRRLRVAEANRRIPLNARP